LHKKSAQYNFNNSPKSLRQNKVKLKNKVKKPKQKINLEILAKIQLKNLQLVHY